MDRTGTPAGPRAVDRVRAALAACGFADPAITTFTESTATAADAATAIGTTVGRIVKSLVFMAGDQPLLVLASGPNRVDLSVVTRLAGHSVRRASADEVRAATGFAIGGVPPLGHARSLRTYIDRDLLQYEEIWAAAGTPNTVFPINPRDLVRVTNAQVADLKQQSAAR
jgi:prolyl-tRNA editing enzyme YbaK/EbsC (Cys-tRNA(Pro) deacylase)